MPILYRVKPVSQELIALEALQAVVKQHVAKQAPKEKMINILQEYRKEIDPTISDLVRVDAKMADEYLDSAMTIKYQQRLADLAGATLANSATLSFKSNRGDFEIIPIAQSAQLRKRISSYKRSLPTYTNAKNFLRAVRLFTETLKVIPTYTSIDFFKEAKDASAIANKLKDLLGSFDSCFGSTKANGDVSDFDVTWSSKSGYTKEGFHNAGWTAEGLIEYQTGFQRLMMDLSKAIYGAAQAINCFNMGSSVARSYSLFSVFAERLAEGLNRIPTMFITAHMSPWEAFRAEVLD